jgi:hypothetical protein
MKREDVSASGLDYISNMQGMEVSKHHIYIGDKKM